MASDPSTRDLTGSESKMLKLLLIIIFAGVIRGNVQYAINFFVHEHLTDFARCDWSISDPYGPLALDQLPKCKLISFLSFNNKGIYVHLVKKRLSSELLHCALRVVAYPDRNASWM